MIKAVLFDLDGTLLDTARDLGNALNAVLSAKSLDPLSYKEYRLAASDGAMKLLELGFGDYWEDQDKEECRQAFLEHYSENLAVDTCLFDGVVDMINSLERQNIPYGIVTNKPGYLTDKIIPEFSVFNDCQSIISGDSLPVKKPDPAPLIYAAGQLSVLPQHILYFGDAERDIQAAIAANMKSAVAAYGYLEYGFNPERWNADFVANHPMELIEFISSCS